LAVINEIYNQPMNNDIDEEDNFEPKMDVNTD
jgi:hypothetical protein